MTQPMLEVAGAQKAFGKVVALSGVDLTVAPGRIAALLGPNGAGKTTLVRIVATLVRPDAGVIRVDGFDVVADPYAVRARIGLTGQYAGLDEALSGRANLMLIGRLRRPEPRHRPGALGRADRPLRPGRGGRAAGRHLLRRHAPPRRPGRQPDGPARSACPGRADHRAGPGRAAPALGVAGRAARRGDDHAAHHPVPGGSRTARRPGVHPGSGQLVASGTPAQLRARTGTQLVEARFQPASAAAAAARALAGRLGCRRKACTRTRPPGGSPWSPGTAWGRCWKWRRRWPQTGSRWRISACAGPAWTRRSWP